MRLWKRGGGGVECDDVGGQPGQGMASEIFGTVEDRDPFQDGFQVSGQLGETGELHGNSGNTLSALRCASPGVFLRTGPLMLARVRHIPLFT